MSAIRRRNVQRAVAAALAALTPMAALACGACDEDKIAATYDHQLAIEAAAAGDAVVYCEVVGVFETVRLVESARRARGIRPRSVRTSANPAALSFVVDSAQQSPQEAVASVRRRLPRSTQIRIVAIVQAGVAQPR